MPPWELANGRFIDLTRPRVMAILNITPDSFSDGGQLESVPDAVAAAARAVESGAAILDIGGESTRPGSQRVSAAEQIRRIVPVIAAIRGSGGSLANIPLSVDTTLSQVAQAALDSGADAINDVSAGAEDPAILSLAATRRAGLILMHRELPPHLDSYSDRYATPPTRGTVSERVIATFTDRILPAAYAAAVRPQQILVDPGLGFGKTVEQNLELIQETPAIIAATGRPVLSGLSRKSFVGRVSLGRDSQPNERLAGTLALSILHSQRGAILLRVHDVEPHIQALAALEAARLAVPPTAN